MANSPDREGMVNVVFAPAFVVDRELRITEVNHAANARFGSVVGQRLEEVLGAGAVPSGGVVAQCLDSGSAGEEDISVARGGDERVFTLHAAALPAGADTKGRVLIALNEKGSEEELRERLAEQEARLADFHNSTMELAMGASECFQVLTAMRQGNLAARVSEQVLSSSDELIANFGRTLNDTARELEAQLETIKRQEYSIQELSTPILELWDDVVALPVIGVVDTRRSADIMERLLTEVSQKQARYVILDITGVEVVDTRTADHFIKVIKAAQLLGATCLLTGIRPAVAQTLVELGVDLGELATLRNLRDGLRECLRRMGAPLGAALQETK
jgi:anti-anti-sigma regulatory factor